MVDMLWASQCSCVEHIVIQWAPYGRPTDYTVVNTGRIVQPHAPQGIDGSQRLVFKTSREKRDVDEGFTIIPDLWYVLTIR